MHSTAFIALVASLAVYVGLSGSACAQSPVKEAETMTKRAYELNVAGKVDDAIVLAKRALELRVKTHPAGHPDIAGSLNDLATLYSSQGRDRDAENLLRQAIEIYEKVPANHPKRDLGGFGVALHNLASIYSDQGRLNEAADLFRRSANMHLKVVRPGHPDLLRSADGLAEVYFRANELGSAEFGFKSTLAARLKSLPADHLDFVYSLDGLARVSFRQGQLHQAEEYYQAILVIRQKRLPAGHPKIAGSFSNVAFIYHHQKRFEDAERYYKHALAISQRTRPADHFDIMQSLNNLAGLYFEQNDWPKSVDYWRQSTGIVASRGQRDSQELSQALVGRRYDEPHRYNWQFLGLAQSLHRLAQQQLGKEPELLREAFRAAQWSESTSAAQSLAQMGARGATDKPGLSNLVRERQDRVRQWQGLDAQRVAALGMPPEIRNRVSEQANAAQLAEVNSRIAEIDQRLASEFPEYSALVNPLPMSVEEVQAQLDEDEALVVPIAMPNWITVGDESLVWIVTKTDVRWVRSELGTRGLGERVAALRCGLDAEEWAGNTRANQCAGRLKLDEGLDDDGRLPFNLEIAHEIYWSLFGPVERLLKGKRLLIVPSGPLTSLPLHVLVTQKPERAIPATFEGYRDVAWLGRSHAITVLPAVGSLKTLRAQAVQRARPTDDYIGIGNPVLTGTPGECRESKVPDGCPSVEAGPKVAMLDAGRATIRGSGRRNAGKALSRVYDQSEATVRLNYVRSLCPLPDTSYELACVRKQFAHSALHERADASEVTLRRLNADGTLARYRIVHFATHGLVAGDLETLAKQRGEPALVLTPPDRAADADDDGLLTASEVAQLRLNAEWIVLSACSTAASDGANAEALSGLARAFFYAGTRALLVSHWPVYSDAAVHLTTRTFAELERNPKIGRADALRRAMIALMDDGSLPSNAHPAVWAPFVIVGEGGLDRYGPVPVLLRAPTPISSQKAPANN